MKQVFPYFLMIIITVSCNSKQSELTLNGTWRLYDVTESNTTGASGSSFEKMAALKKVVQEGLSMNFFEDGSYSDIAGGENYTDGAWKFSKKYQAIKITYSGKAEVSLPSKLDRNAEGKQVLFITNAENDMVLKFIKESLSLKDYKNDPFYPANNKWRHPAKQQESSAEIVSRLSNYIKHNALILKSATDRKQNIVSFEFSKGPVRIYNGGIGIYPYKLVPESWKQTFYNDADAELAYEKFENYLRTNSYRGGGTGNWMEDDYTILLSIYSGISKTK